MDINKIIEKISRLMKQIEKTEFDNKTPIWKWESMNMELEDLNKKLGVLMNG